MKVTDETYLGDGIYASFDGYQIKLRAPRENGDHEIYMDNVSTGFFLAWMKNSGLARMF